MKKLSEFNKQGIEKYLLDILGDDPVEHREDNYVKALNGIGIDGLRRFILSLLDDGIPEEIVNHSYFHPNKFFKLGICRLPNKVKLRLHFWSKEHLEVQTPIHFHAWDFASLLVLGSYTHEIYSVEELDPHMAEELERYRMAVDKTSLTCPQENYLGLYKIPQRSGSEEKFQPGWVKDVKVNRIINRYERQGSAYFIDMQYPHRITIDLKEVGSMVTLVLTSETHSENLFTFQPITRAKVFNNPSPNVDQKIVYRQLELILSEINKTMEIPEYERGCCQA